MSFCAARGVEKEICRAPSTDSCIYATHRIIPKARLPHIAAARHLRRILRPHPRVGTVAGADAADLSVLLATLPAARSPLGRAVFDHIAAVRGQIGSAQLLARRVGLVSRHQLHRRLQRDGLPSAHRLAGARRLGADSGVGRRDGADRPFAVRHRHSRGTRSPDLLPHCHAHHARTLVNRLQERFEVGAAAVPGSMQESRAGSERGGRTSVLKKEGREEAGRGGRRRYVTPAHCRPLPPRVYFPEPIPGPPPCPKTR